MRALNQIIEYLEKSENVDLKVKSRKRHIVYMRSIYFKIARKQTSASLSAIGKMIGKDNHSTVINCLKKFDYNVMVDPGYKDIYYKASEVLKNLLGYEELPEVEKIKTLESRNINLIKEKMELQVKIRILEKQLNQKNPISMIPEDKIPDFTETKTIPYLKMLGIDLTGFNNNLKN